MSSILSKTQTTMTHAYVKQTPSFWIFIIKPSVVDRDTPQSQPWAVLKASVQDPANGMRQLRQADHLPGWWYRKSTSFHLFLAADSHKRTGPLSCLRPRASHPTEMRPRRVL